MKRLSVALALHVAMQIGLYLHPRSRMFGV
jgi:hypothetical protein